MSDYRLRLFTECLGSKFGFNDGDMPDDLLDEYDARELPYPDDWEPILLHLVRQHLLPALSEPVEVYEIGTSHNPIRSRNPEDVVGVTPEYVEVTFEQIQAAERVMRPAHKDAAEQPSSLAESAVGSNE